VHQELQRKHDALQVQKLQNGNARLKEQHSLSEETMCNSHARELSTKDGDIRLLQARCDEAVKQTETQRIDSAAKVCGGGCSVDGAMKGYTCMFEAQRQALDSCRDTLTTDSLGQCCAASQTVRTVSRVVERSKARA
jgi:hypothetical protein